MMDGRRDRQIEGGINRLRSFHVTENSLMFSFIFLQSGEWNVKHRTWYFMPTHNLQTVISF